MPSLPVRSSYSSHLPAAPLLILLSSPCCAVPSRLPATPCRAAPPSTPISMPPSTLLLLRYHGYAGHTSPQSSWVIKTFEIFGRTCFRIVCWPELFEYFGQIRRLGGVVFFTQPSIYILLYSKSMLISEFFRICEDCRDFGPSVDMDIYVGNEDTTNISQEIIHNEKTDTYCKNQRHRKEKDIVRKKEKVQNASLIETKTAWRNDSFIQRLGWEWTLNFVHRAYPVSNPF